MRRPLGRHERHASLCPVTGKKRYRDELAALIALAECQSSPIPGRRESRVYRCEFCHHGWHLTSQRSGHAPW